MISSQISTSGSGEGAGDGNPRRPFQSRCHDFLAVAHVAADGSDRLQDEFLDSAPGVQGFVRVLKDVLDAPALFLASLKLLAASGSPSRLSEPLKSWCSPAMQRLSVNGH
ncbi:hypothetical protein ACFFGR_18570 [Arthrobacter liuii]|uniref:hypothetical protein n=1 Tax=Arthrobacter liuii TaxID=1476996 RepID=UPI00166539EF|nr:hypothetical protein [Arthrobacter liuii]